AWLFGVRRVRGRRALGPGQGEGLRLPPADLRGELDGVEDPPVAGAATEVARDGDLDLLARGARVLVEERGRAHQHARRAEAALAAAHLIEAVDERIEVRRARERLHRLDLGAVRVEREGEAGEHRVAVDDDRAGPAVALVAALLGADQVEI